TETLFKALDISEKHKFDFLTGNIYSNLGAPYFNQNNYDKSIGYAQKSLDFNARTGNENGFSSSYISMANGYGMKGDLKKARNHSFKAIDAIFH
ncbi:MAG TPA: tetratricopeptide repeat protein, partial [Bacteroidia bacterium]